MVTVQDLFNYAVEFDLSHLAHSIFWALSHKKVRVEEDHEQLKKVNFDEVAIKQLMEDNLLGIGKVKLFVMETQEKDWFAFYLAEHSLDAYRLHEDLFRGPQRKITRADRLMVRFMAFAKTGEEMTVYAYKKEVVAFPAYVGHVRAGERVVYRMEGVG
ncbi:hypothetical protein CSV79_12185 [Sporosarcina sp. P13]|uniref:hypothetical protein n=1 Tax=Sporosarcina sp. P13 TaxID=2048263 RepID=UPI000C16BAB4|nr:hypothetical protein [Sporosarcina sp. P13]PIC63389.1 hypothetical protein CSV79_12185 [Sporosarcina sp. P13]